MSLLTFSWKENFFILFLIAFQIMSGNPLPSVFIFSWKITPETFLPTENAPLEKSPREKFPPLPPKIRIFPNNEYYM